MDAEVRGKEGMKISKMEYIRFFSLRGSDVSVHEPVLERFAFNLRKLETSQRQGNMEDAGRKTQVVGDEREITEGGGRRQDVPRQSI